MGMQVPDNFLNTILQECIPFKLGPAKNKALSQPNALHAPNHLDELDLSDKMQSLNIKEKQQKDTNLKLVFHWVNTHPPAPSLCLNMKLWKHLEQFPCQKICQGVLYRKFVDDTGKNVTRQFVVPAHLRAEVVYRIHSSKLSGHIEITRTA